VRCAPPVCDLSRSLRRPSSRIGGR
jgi:hypothetical protein